MNVTFEGFLNKYDLKWKETPEKCRWEHCTR